MSDLIGGIDEVGYGALAGPYISVAVTFRKKDLTFLPSGVTDSKKLSETKLESLYEPICAAAYEIGIGHAWPWEIDDWGATKALQSSYQRALSELLHKPDTLYVDGNHRVQTWNGHQIVEPKADAKYLWVSAASIIAKVWRDRLMGQLSKRHPKYEWNINKGYGTTDHQQAIRQNGIVASAANQYEYVHRKSYCRKLLIK